MKNSNPPTPTPIKNNQKSAIHDMLQVQITVAVILQSEDE